MNTPHTPESSLSCVPVPELKPRRRQGKIAQLPKAQRDLINRLLDDGATYKVAAEELAKQGVSLNGENISNWFSGGYQDYLRECEWRAEFQTLRESAADLSEFTDAARFQQGLLQFALTQVFRALKQGQVDTDSPNYVRLVHALARLNREALALRKYDGLCAKELLAREEKSLNKKRDREKERALLIAAMKEALGCP